MLFTPDERRALLAIGGLLTLGLAVRVVSPGRGSPDVDSLVVVTRAAGAVPGGIAPPVAPPAAPPGLLEEGKLRINTANAADLERLPRVGPALAARIVEERDQGGEFRSVGDLRRVRGIGPKTAALIAPLVSFAAAGDSSPAGAAAASCTTLVRDAHRSGEPP